MYTCSSLCVLHVWQNMKLPNQSFTQRLMGHLALTKHKHLMGEYPWYREILPGRVKSKGGLLPTPVKPTAWFFTSPNFPAPTWKEYLPKLFHNGMDDSLNVFHPPTLSHIFLATTSHISDNASWVHHPSRWRCSSPRCSPAKFLCSWNQHT